MRPQNQPENTIKTDGVYSRQSLAAATATMSTSTKAPNKSNSSYLPAEIQMIILEKADWKLHPTLVQVCRFWRHFIQTSTQVQLNRYFPVSATTHGFDNSPGEAEFPRPRPWVHRSLAYLRQYMNISDKNSSSTGFQPCKLEVIRQRRESVPVSTNSSSSFGRHQTTSVPVCRLWPDMNWGIFKDDPITIFPSTDATQSLKIAPRDVVISFHCCDTCEKMDSKKNQVLGFGTMATVSTYLGFVTEQVNSEMAMCLKRRLNSTRPGVEKWPKDWDSGTVVEFWMGREPLLVFSPSRYDTDTLRLWFDAKVRRCEIDWSNT